MASISAVVAASPFADIIANAEQSYSIPSGLLGAQLYQESTLGANYGNGGGIGQFIPSTAAQYGVDVNDPISGINGAGNYLSDLFQQTGSWVSALQQYGTLPSNLSGNLTAGQQNVLNIAQAADTGQIQPLATATPTATTTTGTTAAGQASSSNPSNWLLNLLGVGSFGNFMLRVTIAVIAIVVIMLGIADLAFGVSPKQVVKAAGKAVAE